MDVVLSLGDSFGFVLLGVGTISFFLQEWLVAAFCFTITAFYYFISRQFRRRLGINIFTDHIEIHYLPQFFIQRGKTVYLSFADIADCQSAKLVFGRITTWYLIILLKNGKKYRLRSWIPPFQDMDTYAANCEKDITVAFRESRRSATPKSEGQLPDPPEAYTPGKVDTSVTGRIFSFSGRAIGFLLLVFLGLVFISVGFSVMFPESISPSEVAVTSIAGRLEGNPNVQDYGRSRYIQLKLVEYPGRSFNIDGAAFEATYRETINDYLSSGDSVFLQVATADYDSNIANVRSSDHILPVAVYSFRSNEHVFLSLAAYCKEMSTPEYGMGAVSLLIGSLFLFAIYFEWRKRKKRRRL